MKKNFLGRLLHYKSIVAIVAAVSMAATPIVSYSAVGATISSKVAESDAAKEHKEEPEVKASPSDAKEDASNTELDVDCDVVNDITSEDSSDKTDETNTDSANADENLDASKASETDVKKQKLVVENAIKKLKEYKTKLNEGTLTDEELSDIETILNGIADFDFVELEISEEDNAFLESFANALDEYKTEGAEDTTQLGSVDLDINEWGSVWLDEYSITGTINKNNIRVDSPDVIRIDVNEYDTTGISFKTLSKGSATITFELNDSADTKTYTYKVNVSDIIYTDSLSLASGGGSLTFNNVSGTDFNKATSLTEKEESGLLSNYCIGDDKYSSDNKVITITSSSDENKTGITRFIVENDGKKYSFDVKVIKCDTHELVTMHYYDEPLTLDVSYFKNPDKIYFWGQTESHNVVPNTYYNMEEEGKVSVVINKNSKIIFDETKQEVYYLLGTVKGTGETQGCVVPVCVVCDYTSTSSVKLTAGDTLELTGDYTIDGDGTKFNLSSMTEHINQSDTNTNDDVDVDIDEEDGKYVLSVDEDSVGSTTYCAYFGDAENNKVYCIKFNLEVEANKNLIPGLVWYDTIEKSVWWDAREGDDEIKDKVETKTFSTAAGTDINILLALDDDSDSTFGDREKVTVKYIFSGGNTEEKTVEINKEDFVISSVTPPDKTKGYDCVITTSESSYGKPILVVTCTEQGGSGDNDDDNDDSDNDDDNNNDNNSSSSSGSSSSGSNTGWIKDSKGWKYRGSDGILAKGTTVTDADGNKVEKVLWQKAGNGYYAFGSDGYLKTGWIYDKLEDKWYYCDESSGKRYGWFYSDVDGYWYYLLPSTGEALTGWHSINGKDYYFAAEPSTPTYSFDASTGFWIYSNIEGNRPFGSMYANTVTPDNYAVDASGAWIK